MRNEAYLDNDNNDDDTVAHISPGKGDTNGFVSESPRREGNRDMPAARLAETRRT